MISFDYKSWYQKSKIPIGAAALVLLGIVFHSWYEGWRVTPDPVPVLSLPENVKAVNGIAVVTATTQGSNIKWIVDPALQAFPVALADKNSKAFIVPNVPGKSYQVTAYTATLGGWWFWRSAVASEPVSCTIVVDGPTPPPLPPNPPNPPTPPSPPAPIPGEGLKVLMVYESGQPLTAGQREIMTGTQVRSYLNLKCVKGPDGKTPEWRVYDANTNLTNESQLWKDAMGRSRTGLPWVIISNGKSGYEGLMPSTAADMLTLLLKFGG